MKYNIKKNEQYNSYYCYYCYVRHSYNNKLANEILGIKNHEKF